MTQYRFILSWLIAGLLLLALGDRVWQAVVQAKEAAKPSVRPSNLSVENFTLQAKVLVGALEMLPSGSSALPLPLWAQQFADAWMEKYPPTQSRIGPARSPELLLRLYLLNKHLGLDAHAAVLLSELRNLFRDSVGEDRDLMQLLQQRSNQHGQVQLKLSAVEKRLLERKLGWFGEVFLADRDQADGQGLFSQSPAGRDAVRVYSRIMLVMTIFCLLVLAGLLCLIWAIRLLKTIPPGFSPGDLPRIYGFEIFGLYLCLMFLLESKGAQALTAALPPVSTSIRLWLNLAGISTLLVLLAWPLAFKVSFRDVAQALGLAGTNLRNAASDIGSGVLGFLATIPLLLCALLVNVYVLSKFGLDPTAGIHPLVPWLLKNKSPQVITLVFILAAGAAPVVEEIMFRGALYAWLRGWAKPWLAMLWSALIFAVVHPQGVFGWLPIFVIGCTLALLREWKQRLLPGMIMHACINTFTLLLTLSLFG